MFSWYSSSILHGHLVVAATTGLFLSSFKVGCGDYILICYTDVCFNESDVNHFSYLLKFDFISR